jgi:hypothetical protein
VLVLRDHRGKCKVALNFDTLSRLALLPPHLSITTIRSCVLGGTVSRNTYTRSRLRYAVVALQLLVTRLGKNLLKACPLSIQARAVTLGEETRGTALGVGDPFQDEATIYGASWKFDSTPHHSMVEATVNGETIAVKGSDCFTQRGTLWLPPSSGKTVRALPLPMPAKPNVDCPRLQVDH